MNKTHADRPEASSQSSSAPDWDDLFSTPSSRVTEFRAALDAYPMRGDLVLRMPLLGIGVPWVVVRIGPRGQDRLGLVVGGGIVTGANGERGWDLEHPFRALVTPRSGPATVIEVDPSAGPVSVEAEMPADPCYQDDPDHIRVLVEMTSAVAAWASRSDLVAAWSRRAAIEGWGPAPGRYLELGFEGTVYRGLQIVSADEMWCAAEDLVVLMTPSGDIVELDAAQADRMVMLGGYDDAGC
ncbi:hypothetical protein HLH33_13760 [Gluconacetobacter diazotrophicus]|uniref:Uncharacterized protein n=1 Tax=Gluconacetobacter diazotrophicus TaxID=33996 RepID=A0A7W4NN22_GLUDI|nr:hypothetical protein [Gluconacetobacter diazotrophicus]MBB2157365.1 hypothetical protein [Gluconacetobacter diazotrophicus]